MPSSARDNAPPLTDCGVGGRSEQFCLTGLALRPFQVRVSVPRPETPYSSNRALKPLRRLISHSALFQPEPALQSRFWPPRKSWRWSLGTQRAGNLFTDKPLQVLRPSIPSNLSESYFVGAGYDGEKRVVYVKLYEPQTHKIHFWYDSSGHLPYCLSKKTPEDLRKVELLTRHPGFLRIEKATRYDALEGRVIPVSIIYARDPLSIGGRPTGCIRDIITAWEADIRYVENYIYDRRLEPGMTYAVKSGKLKLTKPTDSPIDRSELLKEGDDEYTRLLARWLRMLEAPVPNYRRVALDIEVHSPLETRVPDPTEAEYRVICASLCSSDDTKRVLILKRTDSVGEISSEPADFQVEFYDTEEELLAALFRAMNDYPFVLTFNGDDFHLRYLFHRAERIGFTRDQIPIELGRESAGLKYGVHLDLYKFFFNRSIQVYAFSNRYREVTLDAISEALLETGKLEISAPVSRLSPTELAAYCYQDAELVMNLTTFDGEVVMKLITALSRISFLPMEDMSRQGVSGWI